LDLDGRPRVGRAAFEERQAQQAPAVSRPRPRRSQQPVARVPARRPHHRVLLAALRARGRPSFTSGGASLDHEDPRFVYLSRTIGPWNQVEQWFTPDEGRTWTTRQLTNYPDHYAIRPVTPRGLAGPANRVLFAKGDETTIGFTNYRTRIHALDI